MTTSYRLTVNGDERAVEDAWLGESLLHVLRERLDLPGSKGGCEQGECGSCSVLVDGDLVCACLVLSASAVAAPSPPSRGSSPSGATSPTSSRPSSTRAPCSAGSARPGW